MLVTQPKATAHDAARIFAESYSDEGRKVGATRDIPRSTATPLGGLDFQLEGGVRWYSVRMKHDYSGWLVSIAD